MPLSKRVRAESRGWSYYTQPGVDLYRGDCLEVLPALPAVPVDAVITDPPYGIVNRFGTHKSSNGGNRRMQFDWDGPGTAKVVVGALRIALSWCKPTAALFVFSSMDIVGELLHVVRQAGFVVKPAAWVKKYPPPAGKGNWWPSAFELAFYGYRNRPWFGDTDVKRSNVFVADSYRYGQPGKVDHPNQKPLGLIEHVVRSIVPPGGICLDPFTGSGTTGVAALRTGRRFIGMELDPAYFEMSCKRLKEAAGANRRYD